MFTPAASSSRPLAPRSSARPLPEAGVELFDRRARALEPSRCARAIDARASRRDNFRRPLLAGAGCSFFRAAARAALTPSSSLFRPSSLPPRRPLSRVMASPFTVKLVVDDASPMDLETRAKAEAAVDGARTVVATTDATDDAPATAPKRSREESESLLDAAATTTTPGELREALRARGGALRARHPHRQARRQGVLRRRGARRGGEGGEGARRSRRRSFAPRRR